MVKLILPKTIRLALANEVPEHEEILKRIRLSENNNIVEGYTLSENTKKKDPYDFFAEINVDNNRLWKVFRTLMMNMPDYQSLITGNKDDEPENVVHNNYEDKYTILNKLEKYEKELTQDGYLKFGVIHQTDSHLEEVFVHNAKYIQYWGKNIEAFREVMDYFSLYPVNDMDFIDTYPMVTVALHSIDPEVVATQDVLKQLRDED